MMRQLVLAINRKATRTAIICWPIISKCSKIKYNMISVIKTSITNDVKRTDLKQYYQNQSHHFCFCVFLQTNACTWNVTLPRLNVWILSLRVVGKCNNWKRAQLSIFPFVFYLLLFGKIRDGNVMAIFWKEDCLCFTFSSLPKEVGSYKCMAPFVVWDKIKVSGISTECVCITLHSILAIWLRMKSTQLKRQCMCFYGKGCTSFGLNPQLWHLWYVHCHHCRLQKKSYFFPIFQKSKLLLDCLQGVWNEFLNMNQPL